MGPGRLVFFFFFIQVLFSLMGWMVVGCRFIYLDIVFFFGCFGL